MQIKTYCILRKSDDSYFAYNNNGNYGFTHNYTLAAEFDSPHDAYKELMVNSLDASDYYFGEYITDKKAGESPKLYNKLYAKLTIENELNY